MTMDEFETCLKIKFSSSGGILVRKLNSSNTSNSFPIKNLMLIAPSQMILKTTIKNKYIFAFLSNIQK